MSISCPESRSLIWLITGCSSGFGLSLTRTILASGRHTIIATSRHPDRTPDLVAEVESSGGQWHRLDVTEPKASEVLLEKLESSGIHIDVLVNNAGYNIFSPIESASEDEIRGQMETLFFSPLRLIRAALPAMRERQRGVIVNFSSGASLMGNESMGIYAGAKAGLDGLTRVLGKEVAPFNIRTLTVILGTFNTNFRSGDSQSKVPVPNAYEGTRTDSVMKAIVSRSLKPNGDKDKAMKAVYDVIVGQGPGERKDSEPLLVLGNDMISRVYIAKSHFQAGLDAFGDLASSVRLE